MTDYIYIRHLTSGNLQAVDYANEAPCFSVEEPPTEHMIKSQLIKVHLIFEDCEDDIIDHNMTVENENLFPEDNFRAQHREELQEFHRDSIRMDSKVRQYGLPYAVEEAEEDERLRILDQEEKDRELYAKARKRHAHVQSTNNLVNSLV